MLLIGAILVVAAIRDSHGDLFSALATDVPAYAVWATAIIAIGSIGFVPGLKPVSRGLLVLVLVVLVLRNYQPIIAGFNTAWSGNATGTTSNPSSGNAASPSEIVVGPSTSNFHFGQFPFGSAPVRGGR